MGRWPVPCNLGESCFAAPSQSNEREHQRPARVYLVTGEGLGDSAPGSGQGHCGEGVKGISWEAKCLNLKPETVRRAGVIAILGLSRRLRAVAISTFAKGAGS